MSLKEYRRKRNFRSTPEPKGATGRGRGALRFVIQKHDATRSHFDLRLEMGGVFKSWAVPKGPSLNPLDQRLAVRVEDHPLAYGSFEGIIPKGNYGAGTVMIWDEGTYTARATEDRDAGEEALLDGLAKGRITFVMHGKKLSGEFALVRLKRAKEGNAWLLVKKHDAEAVFRPYTPEDRSATTGRGMAEIGKRAEAEGAVWLPKRSPKAEGKAKAKAKPKRKPEATVRGKAQGKRAVSGVPHRVKAMQPVMAAKLPETGDWIFEPWLGGHRAIAEVERGRAKLYSRALLPLEAKFPAVVRALAKLGKSAVLDGEVVTEDGKPVYRITDLLYWDTEDLREEPLSERKRKLAALTLPADALRLAPYAQTLSKATAGKGDTVVAKRADGTYRSGVARDWVRARLPRAKTKAVAAETEASERPPLTNLDKVFWPDEGITKGDLVAYYERVAPVILPYLVDRPQSLHRQPDGLRNDGFFHKDMTGFLPRRIRTQAVYSRSGSKTVHYLLCQDRWTLLYLVNLGCIELNPWLSRTGALDRPDWGVIDLDPDGNEFDEVIEVALDMRRVLKSLGADGWCKTSGATGMHIFLPVGGRSDYDTVRKLIEAVCRVVHERHRRNTSLERNPARRRGKIYLDFLQNRRGQTIAAPYCVRPRPGAPVSAPLRWSEVRSGLRPEQFTTVTMPKRLQRLGDVWKDLRGKAYDADACLRKLLKSE